MKPQFIPPEHQQVFCPYCNHPQNELNIEKEMFTKTEWTGYTCEKCGKLFGYIQLVERAYITAGIKEENHA